MPSKGVLLSDCAVTFVGGSSVGGLLSVGARLASSNLLSPSSSCSISSSCAGLGAALVLSSSLTGKTTALFYITLKFSKSLEVWYGDVLVRLTPSAALPQVIHDLFVLCLWLLFYRDTAFKSCLPQLPCNLTEWYFVSNRTEQLHLNFPFTPDIQ